MKRCSRALLGALLLLLPVPSGAYSGIGRAAVERALGEVPESADALDENIARLEAQRGTGDASPDVAFTLAVLKLNRPRHLDLGDPRQLLGEVVAQAPWHREALSLWLDLIPEDDELERIEPLLRGLAVEGGQRGARDFALARVLHRLGRSDEVEAVLASAEEADPAWRGPAAWLRSVLAGERKQDDLATSSLLAAIDALDDATDDLLWRDAVWVATPEELERRKAAEEKREFYRTFWKRRDVFPLTEVNERLGEHYRRLKRARQDYALRSNGYGYFTTHDAFKEHSPDLAFYSSDVVYDYQARVSTWIDHRGLVYIRHGEPDRQARGSGTVQVDTWLFFRMSFKPLLFHFVDRRGINEYVISLNLAQAAAITAFEDDPKQVLGNTNDFRELYGTRGTFHPVFQRVQFSRSRWEVEELCFEEASMMASFLREAWYDDTTSLLKKDDILPFSALSANFRGEGDSIESFVYYAIPEKEIKHPGPVFEFDASLILFSSNWAERITSAEHHFRYERSDGKKPGKKDLLVGGLQLKDLKPGRYNYVFQVTERRSGKIGISRGRFVADYFGPGWVNLSEMLIAERVTPTDRDSIFERNGQRVVPIPTRTVSRSKPAEIYYEIYDLKAGEDGKHHYQIETRILQIEETPTFIDKLLGIGMNVASIFFPYQVFLAQAGLWGLQAASKDESKGLETRVEERTADAAEAVRSEIFRLETKKYVPGIYQAYVTVKDYVTGSLNTRSIRFAVID